MPERIVACFLIALLSSVAVKSEGEYGVGEVSECAEGFASLYHIDAVEGNAERHDHDERQVVIPGINFTCSGTIRKWIFGAAWEDNPAVEAHIELQVWRRSSGSVYTKVGGTTVMGRRENDNQLYEYPLETPLAFQEGDILGYFQPEDDSSDLVLYLEYSRRLRGYHNIVTALEPLTRFDINDADAPDSHYPLLHVETDPPGCGCGFMTLERMYRLLGITPFSTGVRGSYSQQQLIFPDIRFTCSGVLMKWIMGGDWNDLGTDLYPDLQIWRPIGKNTYLRVHSTTISAAVERENNFYEFAVSPPIPFRPGDVLGVFQPWSGSSRLQVDYDSSGRSMNYFMTIESDQVEPSHSTITIDSALTTDATLPLVSVEIVAANQSSILHSSTTTSTVIFTSQQSTTTPSVRHSITPNIHLIVTQTAALSPAVSHSPAHTQNGDVGSDGVSIDSLSVGVGVAGASLVFICATVIVITVLVCLRKRKSAVSTTNNVARKSAVSTTNNVARKSAVSITNNVARKSAVSITSNAAYSSTSEFDSCLNTAYVATSDHHTAPSDEIYTYITPPNSAVPTNTTEAYMVTDILTPNKFSIQNGTHQ